MPLHTHRDQQEKVAEEMLSMTQRLKEQSLAAKSIVQVGAQIPLALLNYLTIPYGASFSTTYTIN